MGVAVEHRSARIAGSAALLLLAVAAAVAAPPPVSFRSERIVLTVLGDRIRVRGDYRFASTSDEAASLSLFYPFPADSLHPPPDTVFIECDGAPVSFRGRGRGVAFDVTAPADSVRVYRVFYEQPCLAPNGCYILTTTAAWRAPLAVAEFEVIVPDEWETLSLTYEADEVERTAEAVVYRFRRESFLPDRDLCVSWRRRSP